MLGYVILFKVLLRFAARSDTSLHQALVQRWRHPAKLLLPLLAILLTLPSLKFPDELTSILQHLCSLALIAAIAWLLAATILGFKELVLLRYDVTASDNLKARAVSAELLGTVTLHCDYRVPVAAVRVELEKILAVTDLWDGVASGLVVLDANDKTVVLRALVSSENSGKGWDLRCHVREKLVEFLQREYPECLPRLRAEVDSLSKGAPHMSENSSLDDDSNPD